MGGKMTHVAGVDVGTECIKVIVLASDRKILGRAVAQTGGYFQERVKEVMDAAFDDAQLPGANIAAVCSTGFGARCVASATLTSGETACHALGSFYHFSEPMCIVDIGGREPKVIQVDDQGRPIEIHTLRRCALGIGTFLMFASRHLDVHPTRLQELAAGVERPALVGSYCSVFGGSDILERLREGASREAVALGCMHSIAERIVEIGGFCEPVRITGGVAEYFPGVIKALAEITRMKPEVVPEPIMVGALGAALKALSMVESGKKEWRRFDSAQVAARLVSGPGERSRA
jgi:predicted CoA-substrate-specific enzyme activase